MSMISGFRPAVRFGSMEKVNQIVANRAKAEAKKEYEALKREVDADYQARRQEIGSLLLSVVYTSSHGHLRGRDILQALADVDRAQMPYHFLKDELPDSGDSIENAMKAMESLGLLANHMGWGELGLTPLGRYVLQRPQYETTGAVRE